MKPNEAKENLVKVQITYRHKEKGLRKNLLLYSLVGIITPILILVYARFTTLNYSVSGSSTTPVMKSFEPEDTKFISETNRLYLHNYVMNDILDQLKSLNTTDEVEDTSSTTTEVDEFDDVTNLEDIKEDKEEIKEVSPEEETEPEVIEEEEKPEIEEKVYTYTDGWTSTKVNVRKKPSTDSKILDTYNWNTGIQYAKYNDDWAIIKYGDQTAYMAIDYITDTKTTGVAYDSPREYQKSYMPYTAITSRSSKQYKLQQQAYTGNYGIRMINNRYLVAIGSFYTTEIGVYFDLVLENGTVIPCILGDAKADQHTDSTHRYTKHDGSVAEFIIDSSAISSMVRRMGNIGYACSSWNSPIVKIIIYDKSI